MNVDHKSTAKAALRNLIATYGQAGTLSLLSEVVLEALPSRRGRPTRDERVSRLITSAMEALLPKVIEAEGLAAAAKASRDDE